MFRALRFILVAAIAVAAAGAAAAAYVLQDPNRFKPRLEALIAEQSGVPLKIGGDLSWRLWPPLALAVADLRADHQGRQWNVGRVTLDLDPIKVFQSPEQWQIQSLTLADVTMREQGRLLALAEAHLAELTPNRPAPFSAVLRYAPVESADPVPLRLNGMLTVDPAGGSMELADTRFETTDAAGSCDARATQVTAAAPVPAADPADVIPLEALLRYDWQGDCRVDWVDIDGARFEDVAVTARNSAGRATAELTAPRFFGGTARTEVSVDATSTPLRWIMSPDLEGVDSQALLAWLDQDLHWAASLAYGGTLKLQGNTPETLAVSLTGQTRFDGGQGEIDISMVRSQLLQLAEMLNQGERIRAWPETWHYQRFVGDWRIDGEQHQVDAALDNLSLTGTGRYRFPADELNMLFHLTFGQDPALPVFDVDPLLYDLPIPVRCRGSLAEPTCRLDADAAQGIVARALSGGGNSELRRKLEQRIDEQVPEEYRDAARSLLEALGDSLNPPPRQR